ncbi:MAG: hypothetical protein IKM32_05190 [Clostridia bacterium]|nr:hypothetical protein [Clostridia bacterium]MBR6784072.1 hypothetical protein [Clostridia bacterium]
MAIWKRLKKFDPEKEKELRNQIEAEGGLEKGDGLAMVLSALLVFLPAALLALGVIVLIAFLFFG